MRAVLAVPEDIKISADELPWVEQAEGVWFKPLRISLERGTWANLIKVSADGTVNRHRHLGPVEAWVLKGRWRYLEHDWVAGPGSFVYEPEGDVHTLVVEGGEEMVTFFSVQGPIEYLDGEDQVVRVDSARSKLELYVEHCRANGLTVRDVVY